MKSKHVIYLLYDYLENQLEDSTRQQVEDHLSSCQHCRTKLQELRNYHELVSRMERSPAPEEIREKVMDQIESGYQIPDTGYQIPLTAHRSLFTVTTVAAIITLLILAVPKEIFLPTTVSIDIAAVAQKKGKGGAATIGGVMKKGAEKNWGIKEQRSDDLTILDWAIVDFRLMRVLDLIDEVEGEVMSAELNSSGETYSHIVVGMSKRNYKNFAEKYNQMGLGDSVPAKAGFSMSNKVLVNLFPIKRRFFVHDYNEDGFDDMVLYYSSGRQENLWYVALNNHMGNFYPSLIIDPLMDSIPAAENYDRIVVSFTGDFNGNGLNDSIVKWLAGNKSYQYEVSINMGDDQFAPPFTLTYGTGIKAWAGNYTHYFGDFNADGLCDMLTKEGNGDVLGNWYVALNNGGTGFGTSQKVVFGGKKYFISH